jgi:hypothetical protein
VVVLYIEPNTFSYAEIVRDKSMIIYEDKKEALHAAFASNQA